MNNSVGLVFNAGPCPIGNLINLMAKLPGYNVHCATVIVKTFVTYQRKRLHSRFSKYVVCLETLKVNHKTLSIFVLVAYIAC